MLKNKKFLMLASAAVVALPVAMASAATTNLDATATFLEAITLTPTDMQFGTIEYSAAPGAPADIVELGTDDSITAGGVFSSSGGTIAAGEVAITGTDGATLDVACEAGGTLAEAGGGTIALDSVEVTTNVGQGAFGTGNACTGIGNVILSFVLDIGVEDSLRVGGRLDGATTVGFVAGAYSTANAGGDDVQIDVVYQ